MKTILIIEDNIDNTEILEAFLEDDFILLKAFDGKTGFEMIKNKKPDMVLLDISLPQMDGIEIISQMRIDGKCKDIPVIALTAHAMIGDKERFIKAGFDDYMSKPIIDDALLIKMINNLIKEN
jgi:CheY-like chemotaxis protein